MTEKKHETKLQGTGNPNPEVTELLLDAEVDGRVEDREGNTAFDYAKENEALVGTDVFRRLMRRSIDEARGHRLSVLAALRRTTISEIVVEAVERTLAEDEVQTLQGEHLSVAGALAQYADVGKRKQEDGAWLRHATVAKVI